jgi:hypothetical protein
VPAVIDQLTAFNGRLARFAGALNGSQPDVTPKSLLVEPTAADPNRPGLSAAIENPLSALSSWDGDCKASPKANTFCSPDGHYHYFRVQTFTGANGHGNGPSLSFFGSAADATSLAALDRSASTSAADLLAFGALIGF